MKFRLEGRRAKALMLGAIALVLAGVVAVCFCCVRIETPQQREERLASEEEISSGWSSSVSTSQEWVEPVSSETDSSAEESSAAGQWEEESTASAASEEAAASSQADSSAANETASQVSSGETAGETETSSALSASSQPAASSQTAQEDVPQTNTVTISISCKNALPYAEELGLSLPEDGVLLGAVQWEFTGTATVWDVFQAVCGTNGIDYRYTTSSMTGVYIRSIAGIGEFDCGSTSGWVYYLNGGFASLGVSSQTIQNGDVICFAYTVTPGDAAPG